MDVIVAKSRDVDGFVVRDDCSPQPYNLRASRCDQADCNHQDNIKRQPRYFRYFGSRQAPLRELLANLPQPKIIETNYSLSRNEPYAAHASLPVDRSTVVGYHCGPRTATSLTHPVSFGRITRVHASTCFHDPKALSRIMRINFGLTLSYKSGITLAPRANIDDTKRARIPVSTRKCPGRRAEHNRRRTPTHASLMPPTKGSFTRAMSPIASRRRGGAHFPVFSVPRQAMMDHAGPNSSG